MKKIKKIWSSKPASFWMVVLLLWNILFLLLLYASFDRKNLTLEMSSKILLLSVLDLHIPFCQLRGNQRKRIKGGKLINKKTTISNHPPPAYNFHETIQNWSKDSLFFIRHKYWATQIPVEKVFLRNCAVWILNFSAILSHVLYELLKYGVLFYTGNCFRKENAPSMLSVL